MPTNFTSKSLRLTAPHFRQSLFILRLLTITVSACNKLRCGRPGSVGRLSNASRTVVARSIAEREASAARRRSSCCVSGRGALERATKASIGGRAKLELDPGFEVTVIATNFYESSPASTNCNAGPAPANSQSFLLSVAIFSSVFELNNGADSHTFDSHPFLGYR